MSQPEERSVSEADGTHRALEGEPIGDRDRLRALAAELAIAEERERRRIASGLHDQVGQMLGIAKIKLGEALAAGPVEKVAGPLAESRRLVDRAIREIRSLSFELSSPVLQELGLEAALASLAESMESRHGIPCVFEAERPSPEISEERAVLVVSAVRELLWNIVKHARARRARITMGPARERLRIAVHDDGIGFDASSALESPYREGGLGLFAVSQRMVYLGGTLEIRSTPDRGTRIVLTVPGHP